MILKKYVFVFFVLGSLQLSATSLLAKKDRTPPIVWGEIAPKHLQMTDYKQDPYASVLYLGDYGQMYEEVYNQRFMLVYEKHVRIKILQKKGIEYGDIRIIFDHDDDLLKDIEAQSFTLNEHGKTVRKEINTKNIVYEQLNDTYSNASFSIPDVKVGSIIEYRYRRYAPLSYTLDTWFFQNDEPKLWSELRFQAPEKTAYTTLLDGIFWQKVKINNNSFFTGHQKGNYVGNVLKYRLDSIPALRSEKYVTTMNDYLTKLHFQVAKYRNAYGFQEQHFKDWKDLAKNLQKSALFGKKLQSSQKWAKTVIEPYEKYSDPTEKMIALYNLVRNRITWNERYRLLMGEKRKLKDVYKEAKGSSAEINLLLGRLLLAAGLETEMLLASTRKHGRVLKDYPYLHTFNHVLCKVNIGDAVYILDAKDAFRPYNMIPHEVIGTSVFNVSNSRWAKLGANASLRDEHMATLKLDKNGGLSGQVMHRHKGYSAAIKREILNKLSEKDYIKEMIGESVDTEYDNINIQQKDSINAPLTVKLAIKTGDYGSKNRQQIFCKPFLYIGTYSNPFQSKTRLFPVDFNFPIEEKIAINIYFPENYILKEQPKNIKLVLKDGGAECSILYEQQGNQLQIMSNFKMKKVVFSPDEYFSLKDFFDKIIAKNNEVLVFEPVNN